MHKISFHFLTFTHLQLRKICTRLARTSRRRGRWISPMLLAVNDFDTRDKIIITQLESLSYDDFFSVFSTRQQFSSGIVFPQKRFQVPSVFCSRTIVRSCPQPSWQGQTFPEEFVRCKWGKNIAAPWMKQQLFEVGNSSSLGKQNEDPLWQRTKHKRVQVYVCKYSKPNF